MDGFPCKARQVQSTYIGLVPADGLGCLLLKAFLLFIKCGSLAMSAGANPTNFRPI
jgi:hypothetical protein